jgi:hypothetical protein
MLITAYFSSSGTPATGLTPTVTVRDVSDGSVVVNAQAMTEVGGGDYKYTFAGYDSTKDYVVLCDGGITLVGTERYAHAGSDEVTPQQVWEYATRTITSGGITVAQIWDALLTGIVTPDSVGKLIKDYLDAAISTRTKPADTQARVALVDTCTVNTDMRGTDGAATAINLAVVDGIVDSILADTNEMQIAMSAVADSGHVIVIDAPLDPDACRVYEYCFAQDDATPLSTVTATAIIKDKPYDYDEKLHSVESVNGTYSAITGLVYWDIVKGARVKFTITQLGMKKTAIIPDLSTVRLSDLTAV